MPPTISSTGWSSEVEPRDDAEVAAAAPDCPEEVGVGVLVRLDDGAVDRDHLDADQVVAREAEAADQEADAAAESQAADAGRAERAAGGGQPVRLRRCVECAPGGAAAGARDSRVPVDLDRVESGQLDDQTAVADGVARDVVTAAADRNRQPVLGRHAERGDDVGGAPAARDRERPPVDERVERRPRLVVGGMLLGEELAREAVGGCGRFDGGAAHCRRA